MAAISLWCFSSYTNIRNIRRTVSTSSTGPGSSTTRSVCRLFCSPKARMALGLPFWSTRTAAQPVTGVAALAEAQFDQPALAGEYFGRQLAAVFTGHGALHRL